MFHRISSQFRPKQGIDHIAACMSQKTLYLYIATRSRLVLRDGGHSVNRYSSLRYFGGQPSVVNSQGWVQYEAETTRCGRVSAMNELDHQGH